MRRGNSHSLLRYMGLAAAFMLALSAPGFSAQKRPVSLIAKVMQVGQSKVTVNIVEVDLSDKRTRIEIGLADDIVGAMEDLSALADRKGAVAAINGTYFDAYSDGPVWNPVGTIITGGRMVHKGGTGTVIGFGDGNSVHMEAARFKIVGATEGSYSYPHSWYAHHINRASTARDSAVLYTPEWGRDVGGDGGSTVVASAGRVTMITDAAVKIPKEGFALHLRGSEKSLLSRFRVGSAVEWKLMQASGAPLKGFWAEADEAIGAGPRLVWDGKASFNISSAMSEGFTEAKVLSQSLARSAVGVTKDGRLLMVTTSALKMQELAALMLALGSEDAMSFDGGASSGLWFDGEYVTKPGRQIPNAILVYEK